MSESSSIKIEAPFVTSFFHWYLQETQKNIVSIFKRHKKRLFFNIFFFIEGGRIRIKEGSNNMICMWNFLIVNNFIRECRGQDILRERTWGDPGFTPCFIFYFLHTKIFFQSSNGYSVESMRWCIFGNISKHMIVARVLPLACVNEHLLRITDSLVAV